MRISDRCRSCGSNDLIQVYDLGDQYLSDFREDSSKPAKFPLTLMFCSHCTLVQLAHTANRELLYTDNYGFRSGVNPAIAADLKSIVDQALTYNEAGAWLDIACNDGTLLSFVPPEQWYRVGVDPVEKFFDSSKNYANEIYTDYFDAAAFMDEQFDVVTSISMFYDVDDVNEFVAGVARILSRRGVWIIQQNYLLPMIKIGAIDNVCHEHLTYFSLRALVSLLGRYDLEVIDVSTSDVNGGVLRTVVVHKDRWPRQSSVDAQLEVEAGLVQAHVYLNFANRATANLIKLNQLIRTAAKTRDRIFIYGASTRGAVLWQAAGIDNMVVDFAVERQPEKVGKWYSPVGVRIISEEQMRQLNPHYLLVGPWWHRDMFMQREAEFLSNGGKMIFPLPSVEVVG